MEFRSNETIASQIVAYIKKQIYGGAYGAGDKIPTIREFAAFCSVNPNTVAKSYAQLEAEGLIYTDSTLGKFVITDKEKIRRMRRVYLEKTFKAFRAELSGCGVLDDEFALLSESTRNKKGDEDK